MTRAPSASLGTLLFIALLALMGLESCHETPLEKLDSLSHPELVRLLDSLNREREAREIRMRHLPTLHYASVKAGQGLFQVMQDVGVDNINSARVIAAISDSVEFVKLRVGDQFVVGLDPIDKHVVCFRYSQHPALLHLLTEDVSGILRYSKVEKPTDLRTMRYVGTLEAGSSLDGSLRKIGINPRMIQVVNGVLMCKVSFATHAHPGDQFEVLLQQRTYHDSIWIEGKVLYARFTGKAAGSHEAFLYDDGDPKSTFNAHYTESGEALIFSGLRYPLDRLHISCPYGMRIHPVTGRYEMHNGVDYSTPSGTPVYAVAEGVVIVSDFDPYSGNKIAIKHKDNSSSWYLHLSSRGISRGSKVNGRQVIARSGNTGRSTGPHLHFGFKQPNGHWMNPLTKRMIATPKLEGARLDKLRQQAKAIRELIQKTPVQAK